MRRARGDHGQRPGAGVEGLLTAGEPDRAGDHVEPLVVAGVPVLRRPVSARGHGDLADPDPVTGVGSVLQDPHLGGRGQQRVALVRADHGHLGQSRVGVREQELGHQPQQRARGLQLGQVPGLGDELKLRPRDGPGVGQPVLGGHDPVRDAPDDQHRRGDPGQPAEQGGIGHRGSAVDLQRGPVGRHGHLLGVR